MENNFNNWFAMKWYEDYLAKRKHKGNMLWIDDLRNPPNNYIGEFNIVIARNYDQAIRELRRFRYDIIHLDHDLGEEKTGYDVCKYIIENKIQCKEYRIHTRNPVGRDNMVQLLRRYTKSIIKVI